jgi:hypothetical protein
VLLPALLFAAPPVEVQRPHDQPPILALAWTTASADACPTRAQLIERVAAQGVAGQIGDWVPERHDHAALAVEVEVDEVGDRWRARLSLTDADGRSQRSFSAESCAALADATALIIAVTLDPVAVASLHASVQAGGESQTEPVEADPVEPEPVEAEPPEPEPAELEAPSPDSDPPGDLTLSITPDAELEQRWPEGLRAGFSLHGGVGWGPMAALAAAIGGRVSLFGARWRVEIGGRWATPRRIESNGAAGIFDAWVVEGRGCFVPTVRRLEFPLCPGVELGSVRGRGVPPTSEPLDRSFLWVAPSLSQALSWAPVERVAIGIELGLVVPVTRGGFVVGDSTINGLALVGGRALLNLELRLGPG